MGAIYIVAGVSGSGKSTIANRLQAKYLNILRTVSVTTRNPREGERFGVDYFFANLDIFDWLDKTGQLLESTVYDKHRYGTLKVSAESLLQMGHDVLFNINRDGFAAISKAYPNVHGVFLRMSDAQEQRLRLTHRGMNDEEITDRLNAAEEEITWAKSLGLPIVISTPDIDETLRQVEGALFG